MKSCLVLILATFLAGNAMAASSFDDGLRLLGEKRYSEAVSALEHEAKTNPGSPEVLLNLGWAYWHVHRFDDAWKVGSTLVKLDGENQTFLVFLANTDIERKDYKAAEQLARKALKLEPEGREARLVLSRAVFRLGRQEEGLVLINEVLKRNPTDHDALYRKAGFLAEMGRRSEALPILEKLANSDPSNVAYRRTRARVLSDLGRVEEAKTEWKEVVSKEPDAQSLLNLGYTYWKDKNYDEALRIATILLKLDDNNPTFLRFMANTQIEKLNYEEALTYAQKAAKLAPDDKDAAVILAKALFRLQRGNEAVAIMSRTVKQYPDNPSVLYHWAEMILRLGRYEEALTDFDRLVRIDPTNVAYRLNRAQALYFLGRAEEAIAEWKMLALAPDPNMPALRLLRDDAFNRADWEEAVRWQERIIRQDPKDRLAWEKLAIIFTFMKKYSKEYLTAMKAIEVDPVSITAYYMKAEALEELKLWPAAQKVYEEIATRNPNSLRAQDGLSHVFEAQGHYNAAIAAVHRVAEMQSPSYSPYLTIQEARMLADHGRFGKALRLIQRLTITHETPIPVLLYHGVATTVRSDGIPVTLFRAQMLELKKKGFQFITVSELDKMLRRQEPLPPKPLVLSFDDGRVDTFQNADPVLKELGIHATMFVHLSRLRKPGFHSSPDDIRAWQATGRWDMQAHGYEAHDPMPLDKDGRLGHFLPNRKWLVKAGRLETAAEYRVRIENEYKTAKELLEKIVPGHEVVAFAYPYGDYGQNDYTNTPQATALNQQFVRRYFHLAFVQEQYGLNSLRSNPTDLRRFEVPKFMSPRELAARLTVNDPWVQAKLLEAGLWTRADQLGRAQQIYDELRQNGIDEPQVWADEGLAEEKAGDYFQSQKQFSSAIEPGSDNPQNQLYRKLYQQAARDYGPTLSGEAQYFSDSHHNETEKNIGRIGTSIGMLKLQGWGGRGYYADRTQPPLPRIWSTDVGIQGGIVAGTRSGIEGSYGRRNYWDGFTGHADNYRVNAFSQLVPELRVALRDGMNNVETAPAIRVGRHFHTDGGGLVIDPALNWKITGDYDDTRYNDNNREQDIHALISKRFLDLVTIGAAYFHGDSRFEAAEYYTPKGLNQYTGVVTLHRPFGEKSELTDLPMAEGTLQYEGGYGYQGADSASVQSVRASLLWRIVDDVALTLDGAYSKSPTYLSRRGDAGLAVLFGGASKPAESK